jgi:hypothetical protein
MRLGDGAIWKKKIDRLFALRRKWTPTKIVVNINPKVKMAQPMIGIIQDILSRALHPNQKRQIGIRNASSIAGISGLSYPTSCVVQFLLHSIHIREVSRQDDEAAH